MCVTNSIFDDVHHFRLILGHDGDLVFDVDEAVVAHDRDLTHHRFGERFEGKVARQFDADFQVTVVVELAATVADFATDDFNLIVGEFEPRATAAGAVCVLTAVAAATMNHVDDDIRFWIDDAVVVVDDNISISTVSGDDLDDIRRQVVDVYATWQPDADVNANIHIGGAPHITAKCYVLNSLTFLIVNFRADLFGLLTIFLTDFASGLIRLTVLGLIAVTGLILVALTVASGIACSVT